MPDHELWMAFFRDPDRNLLGSWKRSARGLPRIFGRT
jgi:hypothetical protein